MKALCCVVVLCCVVLCCLVLCCVVLCYCTQGAVDKSSISRVLTAQFLRLQVPRHCPLALFSPLPLNHCLRDQDSALCLVLPTAFVTLPFALCSRTPRSARTAGWGTFAG